MPKTFPLRRRLGLKVLIAFLAAIAPLIGVIIYCNISIHRDAMALARNLISRAISGTTA